eukprot:PhF_6_TR8909/c0_g1_i1/m.14068
MGNCKSNSNQTRQPNPTPPAGPPPRPPPIPPPSQTSKIPPPGVFPGFPKGPPPPIHHIPPPPIHHHNNSLKIPPRMPSTNLPKGPPLPLQHPNHEADRGVAIVGVTEEILPQQPQQDPPMSHIEDESLITEGHSPSPKRSHWNTFRSAAHIIGMTANRTGHSAPNLVQPSPIVPPAPAPDPEEIVTSATPSPSTNKWGVLRAATKLAVMASPKRN